MTTEKNKPTKFKNFGLFLFLGSLLVIVGAYLNMHYGNLKIQLLDNDTFKESKVYKPEEYPEGIPETFPFPPGSEVVLNYHNREQSTRAVRVKEISSTLFKDLKVYIEGQGYVKKSDVDQKGFQTALYQKQDWYLQVEVSKNNVTNNYTVTVNVTHVKK